MAQPETLVAGEEEQLVLNDWSSPVGPKLVLREGRTRDTGRIREKVVRVQHFISKEFICRTMEAVGTRLRRQINHSAGKAPVLRTQVVGLNLELFNGILRRHDSHHVEIGAVRRHAIDQDLALASLAPANLKISRGKGIRAYWITKRGITSGRLALGHHARCQAYHRQRIAAVER